MDPKDNLVPVRNDDTGMGPTSVLLVRRNIFVSVDSHLRIKKRRTDPNHLTRVETGHSQSRRTDSDLE